MQENSLRQTIESVVLIVVMLIVGAIGWKLRLGPQLQVDASSFADFPTRIGRWQSVDILLDSAVELELQADFHLQRAYFTRSDGPVWLYVGYYGTQRGGRPEHTPRGCYTGAGWGIESSRTVESGPNDDLRVNEYLVVQRGERRLVHFWYRSHRRTGILGGLDQNIDRLLGRLLDGRADGALIRVSTPIIRNDTIAARGRLLSFSSLLDPLLGEHWPIEVPCERTEWDDCATEPSARVTEVSSSADAQSRTP